jgi:bacterioferritin-associated ferredoxin
MDRDEIICDCAGITYGEIVDAIKNGAKTVEDISEATDAGNYCGYCRFKDEDDMETKEYHLDEILKENM